MPVAFKDYKEASIELEKGTVGGDTYIVNGRPMCFSYAAPHWNAVKALTQHRSNKMEDIVQADVEKYVANGLIEVDTSDTVEGKGWLGTKVWDGKTGAFIGDVGARCPLPAGNRTEHPGQGRCKAHNGNQSSMSSATTFSKTGKQHREGIRRKVEAYATDPRVLDLVSEVTRQKAMLDEIQETVFDLIDDEESDVSDREVIDLMTHVVRLSDTLGKQIERVTMIDQRNALTANQVLYLQIVVKDVLTTYIEDPKVLQKAVANLAERLGTSDFSPKLIEQGTVSKKKGR